MVDAAVAEDFKPSTREAAIEAPAPGIAVLPATAEALANYRAFAQNSACGAAQHPDWVEAWVATRSKDVILISVEQAGRTVMMMPLEIVRQTGCRVARGIGGNHANGNFPPVQPDLHGVVDASFMTMVIDGLRRARPDIDLVLIERQTPAVSGRSNPFAFLPHAPSANLALAVDLSRGFDGVLDRVGRKRRLKKHRAQTRKLEAAGGYRRIEARSEEEVDRLLAAFLQQKAARFQHLGISNVFADMQPFLARLFKQAQAAPRPAFLLHGLEVAGIVRAVTGSSVVDDRLICEFGSIVEDELAHASPGDFLSFGNMEEAGARGFATYDFSVGDEPYKRAWCDIEVQQFDTVIPLSFKGRAYALALQGLTSAKRRIKANDRLWAAVKRLRKGAGGTPASAPPAETDD